MKKIISLLVCCPFLFVQTVWSQSVRIVFDIGSPQAAYAAGVLKNALSGKGYTEKAGSADYRLQLTVDSSALKSEAYSILPSGKKITITGGDARGLIYGSLAVAEDLGNGIPLQKIGASSDHPRLPFRAIKFDLPWDTYRHSYALDLHDSTCRDTSFWRAFLDMMAANRFNVLSLWNLHPYPYMIRARNFPEACPFDDRELQAWQALFHSIFRMAKERGIDTYLIPFNIFVSPEFAKAHHVAMDNLGHDFFVNGDTSEIIKRYTRESVTQVLQEYPDLTGFGLTLGEGMGGMTPQQREDWIGETIIEGMRLADRKSKLIHRIPFSSGTGSLGNTSIETEQLTRKAIDQEGSLGFLEGPIWADIKFNWSHGHSTTKLVKVHGGKLFDGYFKPEPRDYKIVWTVRNEDFFCLRWGVPDFIRAHIAANSPSYVGGYFIGSETYIPAKDYFTKTGGPVDWIYAFQRQWLFYKLWGRLLYDPATPDAVFRDEFVRHYGPQAAPLLDAYALAGQTPLRLASSFDFTWDFSLYSEGFLALNDKTKSVDYISVDRQIDQPPADPAYVSVREYVQTTQAGGAYESNRITPPMLADMLERDANKALDLVAGIGTARNNSLMYEVADVKVWANLGLYFAEKLRGAVALQTYRVHGDALNRQAAVEHLQHALRYWDRVVDITRPIYKEMPLTHYSEQHGNRSRINDSLRFHWAIIRPDVAEDVEIAKHAVPGP